MINLIILLLPLTLFAQTLHMAVLGGSGEPHKKWDGSPNETTIFDSGLEKMGQFNRSHPNIKSEIMFNGGHAHTEEIARQGFGSSAPFSANGYMQMINSYMAKLRNGQIKNGDKILINIYSHGATRDQGEKTHKIAAGAGVMNNTDTVSGVTTVSVDNLKALSDLAKAKGVKLGIVDLSCHSGNTLALADENTCVISATGIEGLVHISEMSEERVEKPADKVAKGDRVKAIVISIDKPAKKIALSMKAITSGEYKSNYKPETAQPSTLADKLKGFKV